MKKNIGARDDIYCDNIIIVMKEHIAHSTFKAERTYCSKSDTKFIQGL